MCMFASLELEAFSFFPFTHTMSTSHRSWIDDIVHSRREHAESAPADSAVATSDDIKAVLLEFCNDNFSRCAKRRWVAQVLKIPKKHQHDMDYVAFILGSVAANFRADMAEKTSTFPLLSIRSTAVCALYHGALLARKRSNQRRGPIRPGALLRP